MRAIIILLLSLPLAACHGGKEQLHGGGRRAEPAPGSEPPMTEAAIAMPLKPGKTEAWRTALQELTGPRYDEYDTSRRRFGLTAQTTFLQRTPMGDLALVYMAGPDVHASFHRMSNSQDDWDVQWRDLTLDLHGVDFAKGEKVMPQLEAAWAMGTPGSSAQEFLFAAPLDEDGLEDLRVLSRELMGPRHDEYVQARKAIGVEREAVFLETSTMGDVAVFYWRAPDPQASLRRFAESSAPFDMWLRDRAAAAHPVSADTLLKIASANTMVGQYPHAR